MLAGVDHLEEIGRGPEPGRRLEQRVARLDLERRSVGRRGLGIVDADLVERIELDREVDRGTEVVHPIMHDRGEIDDVLDLGIGNARQGEMERPVRAREQAVERTRSVGADAVQGHPRPRERAVGEGDLPVELRDRRLLGRERGRREKRGQDEREKSGPQQAPSHVRA